MNLPDLKRDVPFSLKFNAAENSALERLAELLQRPRQEVIRELIRAEAEKRGVWANELVPVPA